MAVVVDWLATCLGGCCTLAKQQLVSGLISLTENFRLDGPGRAHSTELSGANYTTYYFLTWLGTGMCRASRNSTHVSHGSGTFLGLIYALLKCLSYTGAILF